MKITSTKNATHYFIFGDILESDPLYPAIVADVLALAQREGFKAEIYAEKCEYSGDEEGELQVETWITKKSVPHVNELFDEIFRKHTGQSDAACDVERL